MFRQLGKGAIRSGSYVCTISQCGQLAHRLSWLSKLSQPFVMGVTVSSKKKSTVVERVPKPSFASFSTTGTLETSGFVQEGKRWSKQRKIRKFAFSLINVKWFAGF